jgi:hypothetical protein
MDLGLQSIALCNIVSYPLVLRAGGDDAANYSTVPLPSGPSACGDNNELLYGSHSVSTQSGDGAGLVLTVKLLAGPTCTLSGYPAVQAVDSSDAVLVTAGHALRGTLGGLAAGTNTPPTVTLTAGQTVSVLAEWEAAAYTPTSTCYRNARISLRIGSVVRYDASPISQLCDLTVHPWVAGSTGNG